MDKAKLAELRAKKLKQKAELESKRHAEIIESNKSVSDAVATLKQIVLEDREKSTEALSKQLEELKQVANFKPAIEALEKALNAKVGEMAEAVSNINYDDSGVIEALSGLAVTYENNRFDPTQFSQVPKDFLPVRRVIRLSSGNYVFDDNVTSSGGGVQLGQPGNGFPNGVLRDHEDGLSIAVVGPDGNPISITVEDITVDVGNVGLKNTDDVQIDPSTLQEQEAQSGLLTEIRDNLADLEVSVGDVDVNTDELEAKTDTVIANLVDIFTRLNDGSTVVALDAATLAALETINAVVSGTVALDAPTLAALENIVVSGTVALDAGTLSALENINAVVSGEVALDAATLAALESITAVVSGTVELGATTLAALENITVSGTVELGATTLAALETINAVVTGTVALDAPTLAALENISATVSGTVELGATTLAALETITVNKGTGWVDPQTDGLTDAELRAAPVEVDTNLDLSPLATHAKQDLQTAQLATLNSLIPSRYDHMDLVYTGDRLDQVNFELGGSPTTSIVLGYTGDNLTSVDVT